MSGLRAERYADQRARILDAARRLFSEHGPTGVTMSEVAAEAGVARATVFNHFGSKRALVEGITEEVLAGYVDLLDLALAEPETPTPTLVRRLFQQMGEGIDADRRFYRSVFREIAKLSLGLDEGGPGQRARQDATARLVQLLTRGQARGELARGFRPEDLAWALDGLVFGTITHWLYDDASESLPARMQRAADVLLGPVEEAPGAAQRDREPIAAGGRA